MNKTAIVTDSNSGITQSQAAELGIFVLPMPFMVGEKTYLEGITLSQAEFYERLGEGVQIATSQPSPEDVTKLWDQILNEYEEIVHIPMSSGLSGSCQTAHMLSQDYDGKVQVVDNQRISVTLRQSVLDAIGFADQGKDAQWIKKELERIKLESSIYIMVDTLQYLKKGGRITPAAAALGTILKLKPVLQIQGEKLDAFAKARTIKQAKSIMINAMKNDIDKRFGGFGDDEKVWLAVAHTNNEEAAYSFCDELRDALPGYQNIYVDHLSLSVACHIGPGSLAVACSRKIEA